MANAAPEQLKRVIVLGAGVIGLTTALKIQEKGGYHVAIIAEVLPSDPKTIKYTSHWAGAHHVSFIDGDVRRPKMDRDTFDVMWEMSAPGGAGEGCFMRLHQEEYFCQERPQPDRLEAMPDFKVLPKDSLLLKEAVHGISFTTVTIEPPIYLNYLMSRFLAAGGSIVRGAVQHINEVVEGGASPWTGGRVGPSPPDAVVVCVGLSARSLGGVEDKEMYPIRGQTVLLRAPWVRSGRTLSSNNGTWTYIIPRRSGEIIVGGTLGANDWYPRPRPETTRDILERALAIYPELAPQEIRALREPTVDDLYPLIIEEGCGLRPARRGGVRLEAEWVKSTKETGKIPVVHNYGHGGFGYLSSWGSAVMAVDLLESALAEQRPLST